MNIRSLLKICGTFSTLALAPSVHASAAITEVDFIGTYRLINMEAKKWNQPAPSCANALNVRMVNEAIYQDALYFEDIDGGWGVDSYLLTQAELRGEGRQDKNFAKEMIFSETSITRKTHLSRGPFESYWATLTFEKTSDGHLIISDKLRGSVFFSIYKCTYALINQ